MPVHFCNSPLSGKFAGPFTKYSFYHSRLVIYVLNRRGFPVSCPYTVIFLKLRLQSVVVVCHPSNATINTCCFPCLVCEVADRRSSRFSTPLVFGSLVDSSQTLALHHKSLWCAVCSSGTQMCPQSCAKAPFLRFIFSLQPGAESCTA